MGLLAVLCSKSFVYLEEGKATTPSPKLNDWEVASRLSYFLWSSMPDERLFDLARKGRLYEPAVLQGEVKRMLDDAKAVEFAKGFPRQWLQLRKVGMFAPDKTIYPEYDDYLESSMIAETVSFFGEVLKRNDSLRQFIDSDWTMLNERIAVHYDIRGVHGEAMQRVALRPEDHRGGVLTQGAILSLSSDGSRLRPVHRGVWILESLIGKPPPPPPANVPALTTTDPAAPKATVRQKLEAHRADATCAACHRRIDPLGIAFDNYDAIGRWREIETVRHGSGADPKVDPSGELVDGRTFIGLRRAEASPPQRHRQVRRGLPGKARHLQLPPRDDVLRSRRAQARRGESQAQRLQARVAHRDADDQRAVCEAMRRQSHSNGLKTMTPVFAKSAVFRVTKTRSCVNAVASKQGSVIPRFSNDPNKRPHLSSPRVRAAESGL
jgi:hypothetical protein